MALTRNRRETDITESGEKAVFPVKAGQKLKYGALVDMSAGYLKGSDGTPFDKHAGVVIETDGYDLSYDGAEDGGGEKSNRRKRFCAVDIGGALVRVKHTPALKDSDVGRVAYAVDDETVSVDAVDGQAQKGRIERVLSESTCLLRLNRFSA